MKKSTALNRRSFLKGAGAAIALGIAATGSLAGCSPNGAQSETVNELDFANTVEWDAEYDVIVVGYGIAGASTAITAAKEGANVLLLEKASESQTGGNSRVCGQRIGTVTPEARADAVAYCKAMRGGFNTPSDEMIEVFVDGLMENESWVTEELGQGDWVTIGTVDFPDYEGAGSVVNKTTLNTRGFNAQTYRGARDRVESDPNITVWFRAAGKKLIQNPSSRMVHGLSAEVAGKKVNLRAKNGIVLCTGGFEANNQMMQDFCLREHLVSTGCALHNTGDGISMAAECGADLWHLSNLVIDFDAVYPDSEVIAFGSQVKMSKTGAIFVGKDGTRFMNEASKNHHGKIEYHGDQILQPFPKTIYAIFDAPMLKASVHRQFSKGNKKEIANGMFIPGTTLDELASKIDVSPEGLNATVADWNSFIAGGRDYACGRDVSEAVPLKDGPYYALRVVPNVVNTMGGPVRNTKGEIVDRGGKPIPHLYEAGELGDLWPRDYQGSTNFGGGMIFGRISGKSAAAVKDDGIQDSLLGNKSPFSYENEPHATFEVKDGELIGEGRGMGGTPLVAKVTLDSANAIKAVEVLTHSETAHVCDNALELIPQRIVEANSSEVDCITGATTTAHAIVEAVNNALAK